MNTPASPLREFIKNLDKPAVDFWRETLSNLRQLHNDIWNGVRFFLAINGVILAGFSALLRGTQHDTVQAVLLLAIPLVGILLTVKARSILARHRNYYLAMLVRKTLIEKQLGFYDFALATLPDGQPIDLSFPWQVDRKYLEEFSSNISKWRSDQEKRPGLISTTLFNIYNFVIGLHVALVLGVVVLWRSGYFACPK